MIDKGMKDGELMTGNCSYHDVVCWHRIVQSYWIGRTFLLVVCYCSNLFIFVHSDIRYSSIPSYTMYLIHRQYPLPILWKEIKRFRFKSA